MNAETAMPVRSEQHVSRQHNGGTFTRVRGRGWLPHLLAALMLALTAGNAMADAVTEWNQTSIDVLKAANVIGNPWSRTMAMVHVAIADAVFTIQGRYTRYALAIPAAPNASADAAVAAAARGILLQVYPNQKAKVEEAYAASPTDPRRPKASRSASRRPRSSWPNAPTTPPAFPTLTALSPLQASGYRRRRRSSRSTPGPRDGSSRAPTSSGPARRRP